MLAYACTIFLSAFLLFAVQPMIGKIILPWFGGSAAVWSTCLLFFQAALLTGYLYAHWSTRWLKPKKQAMLHIALMAVSLALLPILPSPSWKPSQAGDPSLRILLLLDGHHRPALHFAVHHQPFAASLVRRGQTRRDSLPPVRSFEFRIAARAVQLSSAGGAAVHHACASLRMVDRLRPVRHGVCAPSHGARSGWPTTNNQHRLQQRQPSRKLRRPPGSCAFCGRRSAACASTLLLAITQPLSQNVAPIPFLWVLPLSRLPAQLHLVLRTREGLSSRRLSAATGDRAGRRGVRDLLERRQSQHQWAIPTFVAALFVGCMVCHGELVRLKPDPRHLTSFYLMICARAARWAACLWPSSRRTFFTPISSFRCPWWLVARSPPSFYGFRLINGRGRFRPRPLRIAMLAFTVGLAVHLGYEKHLTDQRFRLSVRNFYGVLRVRDIPASEEETPRCAA